MSGNGQLMRSLRAGGGTGVAAAQQLIRRARTGTVSAAELKEVQKVIDSPELRDMSPRRRAQINLRVAGQKVDEAQAQEAAKKSGKSQGSDKVLGTQMLWNVMHLLRGDELDDVARRDAMNQLAIAAALIIIFAGVVVGVLVAM